LFIFRFIIILITLTLVACGSFDATNSTTIIGSSPFAVEPFGTCDRNNVPTFNLCVEAIGSDYNDQGYLDILMSSCESTGGIYSINNCSRTESLGTCVIGAGQSNETHVTYYAPEYTTTSAQTTCATTPGGIYYINP
jgi:hypothetical protein